ncbi:hypothetical protein [Salinibacter ruber]|uniref:hypothetical protein n=1 Tax=Salinibacter ruber TaxID=146919 RepID=UPI0021674824|nr:hypothetical protein [Salinibacter ruber]MCS3648688.1 putative membrane protein required for colicin V production [Salinibacter ruber]
MFWMWTSAAMAGFIIGFVAGASPAPSGNVVATAVAAFLVGVLSSAGNSNLPEEQVAGIGQLFVVFLALLLVSYVGANVLRKHRMLEWMGLKGPS